MGYNTQPIIPITCEQPIFSPKDDVTYFIGPPINSMPAETGALRKTFIGTSCVIRAAAIAFSMANTPSNEDIEFTIRVNDTTNFVLLTVPTAEHYQSYTRGLNVPLQQGDFIEIKIKVPAWMTPPIGMGIQVVLFAGL